MNKRVDSGSSAKSVFVRVFSNCWFGVFECSLLQLHSKSSVTFLFVHGRKHTVNSEKTLCLRKQFVNRLLQMIPVKETVNTLNRICLVGE